MERCIIASSRPPPCTTSYISPSILSTRISKPSSTTLTSSHKHSARHSTSMKMQQGETSTDQMSHSQPQPPQTALGEALVLPDSNLDLLGTAAQPSYSSGTRRSFLQRPRLHRTHYTLIPSPHIPVALAHDFCRISYMTTATEPPDVGSPNPSLGNVQYKAIAADSIGLALYGTYLGNHLNFIFNSRRP